MNRAIRFKLYLNGECIGEERLTEAGWEWMYYGLNPKGGERWNKGVFRGDDYKLVQFTGLQVNGVDVYEGDRFRYTEHKGYTMKSFEAIVTYNEDCAGFGYSSLDGVMFTPFSQHDELQSDILDHIEIIGNIHQTETN